MSNSLVDYSGEVPGALIAQGLADNYLALYELEEPVQREDGLLSQYKLVHRCLNVNCEATNDDAWSSYSVSEATYWNGREIDDLLANLDTPDASIFDYFFTL